jgi:Arc/MetJ-type ribon-helix-helix transcriptional regulator
MTGCPALHLQCMASQQVVVWIPEELATELERHVTKTRRKRSDIVRDALRAYLGRVVARPKTHAAQVASLIGSLQSGRPALAENPGRYVLESLRRGL